MEKIKCFFNFRSPYSYLGVKKALDKGLDLEFIPLCYLPREVLESFSDPTASPFKRTYLFEDCNRLFKEEGVQMAEKIAGDCNWPRVHAAWLAASDEGLGKEFMLHAYNFRWQSGLNLEEEAVIQDICEIIELNPDVCISAMNDERFDKRLKSYTKVMREYEVFGVPTFLYKRERFWGQDRIDLLMSVFKNT
ncbi:MAG: DsbA family protein [SAR86 cluster bacterium]|nr:DsbA family protein [SAR86 cluster bacterium]